MSMYPMISVCKWNPCMCRVLNYKCILQCNYSMTVGVALKGAFNTIVRSA